VNAGTMYGTEGFIRINLATPRSLLAEGLDRVVRGLAALSK
jgi:cystathionine beta-lyase